MSAEQTGAPGPGADDPALAPPPDELNPALLDARSTFIVTLLLAAVFIGTVIFFIL